MSDLAHLPLCPGDRCIVHRVTKSRTRLSGFHFSKGRERGEMESTGGYTHLTQEGKHLCRVQVQIDSW